MDELLAQFIVEGRELVEAAADDLLALERNPTDQPRIDGALRAVHTLKGSAGLFDLAPMATCLHAAEDVLGAARAGELTLRGAALDALLDCVGAAGRWMDAICDTGSLPPDAQEESARVGESLAACLGHGGPVPPPAAAEARPAWVDPLLAQARQAGIDAAISASALLYGPVADAFYLGDDPVALMRGIPGLIYLRIDPAAPWKLDGFDPFRCNLRLAALSTEPARAVRTALRFVADQCEVAELGAPVMQSPEAPQPSAAPSVSAAVARRSLRVDAARVDALGELAGELMVAGNRLAHLLAAATPALGLAPAMAHSLTGAQAEMSRLAATMQRAVLQVRMLPLADAFRRLPRLVRETAARLDKQIAFTITGEEVEADKAAVDGLFEPLLHLLRNAIDHGIEPPAVRRAAGKPAAGHLTLSAARRGEQIEVTLSDDGRGVDAEQMRRLAQARGLLTAAEAAALNDAAAAELVFVPGLSTASAVTDLSGRGVGMDAVRTAMAALGGHAGLTSRPDAGTTVRLTLPQTLTVTTLITVHAGGEMFGLKLSAVSETLRLAHALLQPVGGGLACVLRDRTVPVLRLADLLRLSVQASASAHANLLIVGEGARTTGIEVDAFGGRLETLVRPLPPLLDGMRYIAGTTLLGDGRIMLILDVAALIA